jgi:hypothetical protein
MRYRKEAAVDVDSVGDDLILMHLVTRRIIILNSTDSVLWDALDTFATAGELGELLREAMPDQPASEVETGLQAMLDSLVADGFLHAEHEAAALPAAA